METSPINFPDTKLSPEQVKKLVINSSDKNLFEKGINVINPKKPVALMREK